MKLTTAILAQSMEGVRRISNAENETMPLPRPLLYEDGTPLREGALYVASAEQISSVKWPENCAILCAGGMPEKLTSGVDLLIFPAERSKARILNDTQACFDVYDAWEADMRQVLRSGGGLQALLLCCEPLFEKVILVIDTDYRVLAASCAFSWQNENLRPVQIGDAVPPDIVSSFKLDPHYDKIHTRRDPYLYEHDILPWDSLCCNLYDGDHYIGRVILSGNARPFRPGDATLLAFASHYFEEALYVQPARGELKQATPQALFADMLDGKPIESHTMSFALDAHGWKQDDPYLCIHVQQNEIDIQNFFTHYLCRRLREEFAQAGSCAFQGGIAALFNLRLYGGTADDLLSALAVFLRDWNLRAGSSNPFSDFAMARAYHLQACAALRIGTSADSSAWNVKFSDCALDYLLLYGTSELPSELVCSPALFRLREADGKTQGCLYTTLRCYLQCERQGTRCAEMLFIHRSTLHYRLKHISQLTGIDLDNEYSRLYLLNSFALLDRIWKPAANND